MPRKKKENSKGVTTPKRSRRSFDDTLKTRIVLEALKEAEPISALASRYEVHPNQISLWKKQFLENATAAFSGDREAAQENERLRSERDGYAKKVGELTMDVEFLKKNLKKLGIA